VLLLGAASDGLGGREAEPEEAGAAAVSSLVPTAAGGGPDGRKAEARHAKQQVKLEAQGGWGWGCCLLHFVKKTLTETSQTAFM
jgi:hypothetical protein